MGRELSFTRPPIVEAILDIRCNLPANVDLEQLAEFHERIKDRFPVRQDQNRWASGFQFDSTVPPTVMPAVGGTVGYLSLADGGRKIAQARLDGFTLNKLKPYEGWSVFISEARALWTIYRGVVDPINVTRLAIRYVNRIEIPAPIHELKDWLLTCPEIAAGCPQEMAGFFMQVALPDTRRSNMAIITETVEPPPDDLRYVPLIFDIDAYREAVFDSDDPLLWDAFESLRETRNSLFYNSMTQRTRELFR